MLRAPAVTFPALAELCQSSQRRAVERSRVAFPLAASALGPLEEAAARGSRIAQSCPGSRVHDMPGTREKHFTKLLLCASAWFALSLPIGSGEAEGSRVKRWNF